MELSKQNILFFNRSLNPGGTTNVILQLCEILQPHVNKIVVCSIGGEGEKVLESMGIRHYKIGDIIKKDPTTFMQVRKQLCHIIKKEHITVVHTHHRMAGLYTALLHKKFGYTFVNTSHNTFTNNKRLTKFAYNHANVIACGGMVKKNLVEFFGLKDSQVTVIQNAVKKYEGAFTTEPVIAKMKQDGNFVVGNVGRLAEQKGFEYFIDSMPILKKNGVKNVKYVIIGDGEDRAKLEEQVRYMNLENDIVFLGYRNDIQNLMSQVDLIVLSSLWEGLPLTPMEAYSVGTPVVATAVDGTVEILRDGLDGYLIDPRSPEQIAEKVQKLQADPALMKQMSANCTKYFAEERSFAVFADKILNYYRSL